MSLGQARKSSGWTFTSIKNNLLITLQEKTPRKKILHNLNNISTIIKWFFKETHLLSEFSAMIFDNIRRTKHLNMRKRNNEKTRFFFNGLLCPNFPERIPLFFLMLLLVCILNSYFKDVNNCRQSCKCSDKYSKALIATICWSFWKELKHVLYILHYLSYHKRYPNQNNKNPNKNKPQSKHIFQVCAAQ